MFVRFRTTGRGLQVSILETRRAAGKVTSEHIASLGSIVVPMTMAQRQAFWAHLRDRLASFSSRIGADDQAKIRNSVHARIPMVMPDEANADEAELDEGVATVFPDNRAPARGERRMDRVVVNELLLAKAREVPAEAQERAGSSTPGSTCSFDPNDYPRRRWGGSKDDYVIPLLGRLKTLYEQSHPAAGSESAKGKDGAAFDALKIAGSLVEAVAGWALDHQVGLALKGLEFVPLQPSGTKQHPDYLKARQTVDDHIHEKTGAAALDFDSTVARKLLINLLRANSGGFTDE
jgi:hypothetical protein